MLGAHWQLGMSYSNFLLSVSQVIPLASFWFGVGKGALFGLLIALVACHFGLRIRPDTESLRYGTTQAVVVAITVVLIADAALAMLFSNVGM
jgi:phospholipid/cholesterol/gamma-HCH transport system permease protein